MISFCIRAIWLYSHHFWLCIGWEEGPKNFSKIFESLKYPKNNVLLSIVNLFLLKCLPTNIVTLNWTLSCPWYQFSWDVGCSIFRWNPDTANTNISPFCRSQADTFSRTTSNHDLRAAHFRPRSARNLEHMGFCWSDDDVDDLQAALRTKTRDGF